MSNPEYRIIFYYNDKTEKDEYVIVEGNYADANEVAAELSDTYSDVSRYYTIDGFYLFRSSEKTIIVKPNFEDMGTRYYWTSQSIYNLR